MNFLFFDWCVEKDIITGDESWIFGYYPEKSKWCKKEENTPKKRKIFKGKKVMISVFFSSSGFKCIQFLPSNTKYNKQYFINVILPDISSSSIDSSDSRKKKPWILHFDNAKPHTAKESKIKIEQLGFIEMPHPPYSPDISPCDFWLFGKLKQELCGMEVKNRDEIIKCTEKILQKITKKEIKSVYSHWIKRLKYVIEHQGEYYQK